MSLLADVVARLERNDVAFALVGAAALSLHGVSRTTFDADLLTADGKVLDASMWSAFEAEVRRGDMSDPLAGVVRVRSGSDHVDVVVAKYKFTQAAIERAGRGTSHGVQLPVVTLPDLILLKLFAGGPQDAWDIAQALHVRPEVASEVEGGVGELPQDARALWERIRMQR